MPVKVYEQEGRRKILNECWREWFDSFCFAEACAGL